jgi:bifunctional non-homologous end joining protein LigD
LLLGLYNGQGALEYVGSVSTGFSKPQAKQVYKSLTHRHTDVCPFNALPSMQKFFFWCRPELVCQVQYGEFSTDGKLRYPIYMTMREDKAPPDCTLQDAPGWPTELQYRA